MFWILFWKYRDYFMESVRLRDFHTSCWSIWNRTSEISDTSPMSVKIPYKALSMLWFVYFIHTEIFASNFAVWGGVLDLTSTNQRGETIFSLVKKSFRLSDWSKQSLQRFFTQQNWMRNLNNMYIIKECSVLQTGARMCFIKNIFLGLNALKHHFCV